MTDFSFGLLGFGLEKHDRVWLHRFGSREWATDCDGRPIKRSDYGKDSSQYGWEMDHIVPQASGGSDNSNNLRPRHCSGNRSAGAILGNVLRSPPASPPGLINSLANDQPMPTTNNALINALMKGNPYWRP